MTKRDALEALASLRRTIEIIRVVDGDLQAGEWDEDLTYYCKLLTESADLIEAALAAGPARNCEQCGKPYTVCVHCDVSDDEGSPLCHHARKRIAAEPAATEHDHSDLIGAECPVCHPATTEQKYHHAHNGDVIPLAPDHGPKENEDD